MVLKTMGDVMQGYWQEQHQLPHTCEWSYTIAQVAISKWLNLPVCIHGATIGKYVADWNAHAVADHDEAVTVLLPAEILHLYNMVHALYHHRYLQAADSAQERCTFRSGAKQLCQKKVRQRGLCWKHRHELHIPSSFKPAADSEQVRVCLFSMALRTCLFVF